MGSAPPAITLLGHIRPAALLDGLCWYAVEAPFTTIQPPRHGAMLNRDVFFLCFSPPFRARPSSGTRARHRKEQPFGDMLNLSCPGDLGPALSLRWGWRVGAAQGPQNLFQPSMDARCGNWSAVGYSTCQRCTSAKRRGKISCFARPAMA